MSSLHRCKTLWSICQLPDNPEHATSSNRHKNRIMGHCSHPYDQICTRVCTVCYSTGAKPPTLDGSLVSHAHSGKCWVNSVASNTCTCSLCPIFPVCPEPDRFFSKYWHLIGFSLCFLSEDLPETGAKVGGGAKFTNYNFWGDNWNYWNRFIIKVTNSEHTERKIFLILLEKMKLAYMMIWPNIFRFPFFPFRLELEA